MIAPRIQLRQVRMFERPYFTQYDQTVRNEWRAAPQVDFKVLLHGEGEPGAADAELLATFPEKFIDWRGQTDGSLTAVHILNIEAFLKSDAEILGIFDDDACFDYPCNAMDEVIERFDRRDTILPSGLVMGSYGPMSDFFWYHNYEKRDDACGELNKNPWAFYGCQFYHRDMLQVIDWRTLLSNLKIWSDFALMMEGHRQGHGLFEAHIEGYKHRGSKGTKRVMDKWTATEMRDMLLQENAFLNTWFANTMYVEYINKLHATFIKKKLQPRIAAGE